MSGQFFFLHEKYDYFYRFFEALPFPGIENVGTNSINIFAARKVMLIFLEEQQQFILAELAEANMEVLGKCVANVSADKARLILKQRRNLEKKKKLTDDQEHALLVELSRESPSY